MFENAVRLLLIAQKNGTGWKKIKRFAVLIGSDIKSYVYNSNLSS